MAIDTTQTGKAQSVGGRFQVGFASVEREYPEPVDLWRVGRETCWPSPSSDEPYPLTNTCTTAGDTFCVKVRTAWLNSDSEVCVD